MRRLPRVILIARSRYNWGFHFIRFVIIPIRSCERFTCGRVARLLPGIGVRSFLVTRPNPSSVDDLAAAMTRPYTVR